MSPSCVQMSIFWAAWNKQCMLAAGKHQKLISWRKETTWRSKTLMLGFYETHFGASWRRSDMLPTMAFWLSCKQLTFFSRQHCLYLSIFFRLLHTIIEIYPFESCPIFYRTTLILQLELDMALYGTDIQRWTMVKALEKTDMKESLQNSNVFSGPRRGNR